MTDRKPTTTSKGPAKKGQKAKLGARAARPIEVAAGEPASGLIDHWIRDLGGWRGATLARMRALILDADREVSARVYICGRRAHRNR